MNAPSPPPGFLVREADGTLRAGVDLGIYGLEVVLKAVHHFTGRCHVHLERRPGDEERLDVRFRAKEATFATSLETLAGEFFNELLDHRLRATVARESEPVRNLILAHALSGLTLVDPELDEGTPAGFAPAGSTTAAAGEPTPPPVLP